MARASLKGRLKQGLFLLDGAMGTELIAQGIEPGLGRATEEYVKAAARVHGLKLTIDQVAQAAKMRQENLLKILQEEPLPAFGGVLESVEHALERDDFRVAIATSGTLEKSRAVLEATKVPYQKMVYINGNDVRNNKPGPELFLVAAERMGIDPANRVVIEDAPNAVQAAKAAGAKCIAVTNSTSAEHLSEADLVCDSLEEIGLDIIQELVDLN